MALTNVADFIFEQAAESIRLYDNGLFWIAVRSRNTLEKLGETVENVGFHDRSKVFKSSGKYGKNVLWCSPDFKSYRSAMIANISSSHAKISEQDLKYFDVDHAFHRAASKELSELYGKDLVFCRMSIIGSSQNSAYGSGIEKRFNHHILGNSDHCNGNIVDLLKSANFNPIKLSPFPYRLIKEGLEFLFKQNLIQENRIQEMYSRGTSGFVEDQRASGVSYAKKTRQY